MVLKNIQLYGFQKQNNMFLGINKIYDISSVSILIFAILHIVKKSI